MLITSLTNDKIKNLVKLQTKKYREEEQRFIVEGDHLISEAYKTGKGKVVLRFKKILYLYLECN